MPYVATDSRNSYIPPIRSESTVPTQASYLLNDPFVREQAEATQHRLLEHTRSAFSGKDGGGSAGGWSDTITHAYRLTLGRTPSTEEARTLWKYLTTADDPVTAWTDIVQALFACADFRLLN